MEQFRNKLLRGINLPEDIISTIRDYDPIYRDYFTRNIVKYIPNYAVDYWENRAIDYVNDNIDNLWAWGEGGSLTVNEFQFCIEKHNYILQFILPHVREHIYINPNYPLDSILQFYWAADTYHSL